MFTEKRVTKRICTTGGILFLFFSLINLTVTASAQDTLDQINQQQNNQIIPAYQNSLFVPPATAVNTKYDFGDGTSETLIIKAWEAYNKGDFNAVLAYCSELIKRYGDEAKKEQASLTDFAPQGQESKNWALNDVATAYFVLGQAYAKKGDKTDALAAYQTIVDDYSFAQCYDPAFNGYWKVSEAANDEATQLIGEPDGSWREETSYTAYNYDANGRLIGATGYSTFTGGEKDAQGNIVSTYSGTSVTTYQIIAGKAKAIQSTSTMHSEDADGSFRDETSTVNYTYDATGCLTGATGSSNFSGGEKDATGATVSTYTGTSVTKYEIIAGKAKALESTSVMDSKDLDGSTRHEVSTVKYMYDSGGALRGASGSSTFTGQEVDADGNVVSNYTGTSETKYSIIYGKAKATQSTSTMDSVDSDGSFRHEVSTVKYAYDKVGHLTAATGSSKFNGGELDATGATVSTYTGTSKTTYAIIAGKAKAVESTSVMKSVDSDGSFRNETSTVEYTYGATGLPTGASGSSTFSGGEKDANGKIISTYKGTSVTTYQMIAGKAKAVESTSTMDSVDSDGSFRHEESTVNYTYNDKGQLKGATGSSTFNGGEKDRKGNIASTYTGTSNTTYAIIAGKAKATASTSTMDSVDSDGSFRHEVSTVNYTYDATGHPTGATGSSTFNGGELDATGAIVSTYTGTSNTTYQIIAGKAKAVESTSVMNSKDSDGSFRNETSTVKYTYDATGHLTAASGSSDFNGGETGIDSTIVSNYTGHSDTTYAIIAGKAKAVQSTSTMDSADTDGSYRNETSTVKYAYDGGGHLTAASGSSTFSGGELDANSAIVSTYTGTSKTTYQIIAGKAKAVQSTSTMDSADTDGSFRHEVSTVKYTYDATGHQTGATGFSTFNGGEKDATGAIISTYKGTSNTTYQIIAGKAKATQSISTMDSVDSDGSFRHEVSTVNYTYNTVGHIATATGSSTFNGGEKDKSGRIVSTYTGTSNTTYEIIAGKAKAVESTSVMNSKDSDGSYRNETSTVKYAYDTVGHLTAASGSSDFNGGELDAKGATVSTYNGTSNTTYQIIAGKAKAVQSTSTMDSLDTDGSFRHEESTVNYTYDTAGHIATATGSSTFNGGELDANSAIVSTYKGTSNTTYAIIAGKAKAVTSTSTMDSLDTDGSFRHEESTVNYTYDDKGHLAAATGSSTFNGGEKDANDATVSTYKGTSNTTYAIIAGKAKAVTSTSTMDSADTDGSTRHEVSTVRYSYDGTGHLITANGSSTFSGQEPNPDDSTKPFSTYTGTSRTTYAIIAGKAKAVTSTSTMDSVDADGSTRHEVSTVKYTYDATGHQTGASGSSTFSGVEKGVDDAGNSIIVSNYTGTSTTTYVMIQGKAKAVLTESTSTARDKDGNVSTSYTRQHIAYDQNGKQLSSPITCTTDAQGKYHYYYAGNEITDTNGEYGVFDEIRDILKNSGGTYSTEVSTITDKGVTTYFNRITIYQVIGGKIKPINSISWTGPRLIDLNQ